MKTNKKIFLGILAFFICSFMFLAKNYWCIYDKVSDKYTLRQIPFTKIYYLENKNGDIIWNVSAWMFDKNYVYGCRKKGKYWFYFIYCEETKEYEYFEEYHDFIAKTREINLKDYNMTDYEDVHERIWKLPHKFISD